MSPQDEGVFHGVKDVAYDLLKYVPSKVRQCLYKRWITFYTVNTRSGKDVIAPVLSVRVKPMKSRRIVRRKRRRLTLFLLVPWSSSTAMVIHKDSVLDGGGSSYASPNNPKRVCVIGAGVDGTSSAPLLTTQTRLTRSTSRLAGNVGTTPVAKDPRK